MEFKLFAVRVFVRDWDRALEFYTETLGIPTTFRGDEMGWAQLATGEGQLAIERAAPDDEEAQELVGRFVGVSLQVSDIHATHRALVDRGVEFVGPPGKPRIGPICHELWRFHITSLIGHSENPA
jgi:lactoylglutathione lyase